MKTTVWDPESQRWRINWSDERQDAFYCLLKLLKDLKVIKYETFKCTYYSSRYTRPKDKKTALSKKDRKAMWERYSR